MQVRPRFTQVLSRGENKQVASRRNRHRRESPSGQVFGIVCEVPATEVDSCITLVLELDPVLEVTALICEASIIAGHEFTDENRLCPALQGAGEEDQQEKDIFIKVSHWFSFNFTGQGGSSPAKGKGAWKRAFRQEP